MIVVLVLKETNTDGNKSKTRNMIYSVSDEGTNKLRQNSSCW